MYFIVALIGIIICVFSSTSSKIGKSRLDKKYDKFFSDKRELQNRFKEQYVMSELDERYFEQEIFSEANIENTYHLFMEFIEPMVHKYDEWWNGGLDAFTKIVRRPDCSEGSVEVYIYQNAKRLMAAKRGKLLHSDFPIIEFGFEAGSNKYDYAGFLMTEFNFIYLYNKLLLESGMPGLVFTNGGRAMSHREDYYLKREQAGENVLCMTPVEDMGRFLLQDRSTGLMGEFKWSRSGVYEMYEAIYAGVINEYGANLQNVYNLKQNNPYN